MLSNLSIILTTLLWNNNNRPSWGMRQSVVVRRYPGEIIRTWITPWCDWRMVVSTGDECWCTRIDMFIGGGMSCVLNLLLSACSLIMIALFKHLVKIKHYPIFTLQSQLLATWGLSPDDVGTKSARSNATIGWLLAGKSTPSAQLAGRWKSEA